MKANEAPEKIHISVVPNSLNSYTYITCGKDFPNAVEYIRTDAFIEKVLRWYCLDCACNDNCAANHKCAFWSFFKDYLEGNDKALPPKISNAFNPDGSTTENYRYRHIIERMQDALIKKACEYLEPIIFSMNLGDQPDTDKFIEDFKNYMKGE